MSWRLGLRHRALLGNPIVEAGLHPVADFVDGPALNRANFDHAKPLQLGRQFVLQFED